MASRLQQRPTASDSITRNGDKSTEPELAQVLRKLAKQFRSGSWGSRVEFVYQSIRTILQTGQLSAGQRLREEEIANLLGVSRTPVRAALQRLQQQGLLDLTEGRSLGVVSLNRQQLVELYELRQILEGWSARLAAQRASEGELAALKTMIDEGLADPTLAASRNRDFHDAIHQAAHNRYLLRALAEVHDAIALLGRTTLLDAERAHQANSEHAEMLTAIARHDAEAADRAAQQHVMTAMKVRLDQTFS
jgi:DNA-binding GntR family transcriptional regulator